MRALGITLALCSASVLWPDTARADAIRAREAVATWTDDHASGGDRDRSAPPGPSWANSNVAAEHSAQIYLGDDSFLPLAALEHSARFANHGAPAVFADDRTSFHDAISVDGFGFGLDKQLTLALRTPHLTQGKAGEQQGQAGVRSAAISLPSLTVPAASPTPEPASVLLFATGLTGLFFYRRRLFA